MPLGWATLIFAALFALVVTSAAAAPTYIESLATGGSPEALAVDQGNGDLYVYDRGSAVIKRYDSTGAAANFSASASYISGNELTGTSGGSFSFPSGEVEAGIAVAPPGAAGGTAGNLYVTQSGGNVAIFASSGEFLGQLDGTGNSNPDSGGFLCGVTTDSAGNVYLGYFSGHIDKYVPSANPPVDTDFDSEINGVGSICSIAAGSAAIYSSAWSSGPLTRYALSLFPGAGGAVDVSSSGTVIEDGGGPVASKAAFVDPSNDDVYVNGGAQIAQVDSSGAGVDSFGAGKLTASAGVAIDRSTGVSNGRIYAPSESTVAVFAQLPPEPPAVLSATVSHVGPDAAQLDALVNPKDQETSYRFEYGLDSTYGRQAPIGGEAGVGNGVDPVSVSQPLAGLQPGTTYHFRIVATNATGSTPSADRTFTTYSEETGLPNGRAYELVSPPNKPIDIMNNPTQTRSAADGNGVMFGTDGAFGDAAGSAAFGSFIATRTADAWQAHSIIPPTKTPPGLLQGVHQNRWVGNASPDLNTGILMAGRPQNTEGPNVQKVQNLYRRSDLLTAGPGTFELLSDSVAPVPKESGPASTIALADASADFEHVIFEVRRNLTQEAIDAGLPATNMKLYESESSGLRLAAILPNGEPAPESFAGHGQANIAYTINTISDDGAQIVFLASPVSIEGGKHGDIYVRQNGLATYLLNESERDVPAAHEPAYMWAATPDGRFVYFATPEPLTNEDDDAENDVYSYDTSLPPGNPHNLTLLSASSEAFCGVDENGCHEVLGSSDDGSYVYFAGGQNGGGQGRYIYVWHEGQVTEVAKTTGYDQWNASVNFISGGENGLGGTGVRVTPGGLLMYTTNSALTAYDTTNIVNDNCLTPASADSRCNQIYVYDPVADDLECASCNPSGANPSGFSGTYKYAGGGAVSQPLVQYLNRPISVDGRFVFFNSPDPLVASDTNGRYDVYEFDRQVGRVALISTGQCDCDSLFADASLDGHDVFFTTEEQLVRTDGDNLRDLYDARIGGGMPSQNAVPPSECQGDACQAPVIPPNDPTPGSASFSGQGNPKTQSRQKHRKRQRAKRRHRKQQQAQRRSSTVGSRSHD